MNRAVATTPARSPRTTGDMLHRAAGPAPRCSHARRNQAPVGEGEQDQHREGKGHRVLALGHLDVEMGGAEDQGQTQIDLQATVIEATEHGGGQGHPEWDHQLIDVEKGEGAVQHDPRRSGADGPGRRREHHAVHRVAVEQRLRRQNHGLGLGQAMSVEVRRSRVDHFGNDRDAHQEGHGDRRRSGY